MSHSPGVVRPVVDGDLEMVAGIFAHYVTSSVVTFEETPPDVGAWRDKLKQLADLGLPFLVVEADTAVAGYAYAAPWRPKPAYRHTAEDTVYLDPRWHGKGLGTALLTDLLVRCAYADVRQVLAVVADTGDPASAALHTRCGFTEVGRLGGVGHKFGRWIDTTLLQCDLTSRRR